MARNISYLSSDLAKKLEHIERTMQRKYQVATVKAGEAAADKQRDVLRSDSGGDLSLSGVNKSKGRAGGAKIDAKSKLLRAGKHNVTAEVRAVGPVPLIDANTKPRRIASAYAGGTRAARSVAFGPVLPGANRGGRRAVLKTPFGFRRSVRHPGTKGKGTWNKGKNDALREAGQTIGREMDQAFRAGASGGN